MRAAKSAGSAGVSGSGGEGRGRIWCWHARRRRPGGGAVERLYVGKTGVGATGRLWSGGHVGAVGGSTSKRGTNLRRAAAGQRAGGPSAVGRRPRAALFIRRRGWRCRLRTEAVPFHAEDRRARARWGQARPMRASRLSSLRPGRAEAVPISSWRTTVIAGPRASRACACSRSVRGSMAVALACGSPSHMDGERSAHYCLLPSVAGVRHRGIDKAQLAPGGTGKAQRVRPRTLLNGVPPAPALAWLRCGWEAKPVGIRRRGGIPREGAAVTPELTTP